MYSRISLYRTPKGPKILFQIEKVRDKEMDFAFGAHKGTEICVRDREIFEIEGNQEREILLYLTVFFSLHTVI